MTALTLAEAAAITLARVGSRRAHRTGARIRRDSLEAGTFEDTFFMTPAKGEPDRMVRAARMALDAGRRLKRAERAGERLLTAAEQALTGMTAGAVRVFEELCAMARLNAGRVFPSYDRLAEGTALGRATVARALVVLEATGLLVRQRRFKRVEGEGPRYAQTSNAYRPVLSRRLLDLLPRWPRPTPLPADIAQRMADRAEEVAAMEASLSARELARDMTTGPLGRMLSRLGDTIDRRTCESQNHTEPLSNVISKNLAAATTTDTNTTLRGTDDRRLRRRMLPEGITRIRHDTQRLVTPVDTSR